LEALHLRAHGAVAVEHDECGRGRELERLEQRPRVVVLHAELGAFVARERALHLGILQRLLVHRLACTAAGGGELDEHGLAGALSTRERGRDRIERGLARCDGDGTTGQACERGLHLDDARP
jgi:hypothetical protein